jgi:hypothetical protein
MREYSWKEAGEIEGISHKELISLQMLQYMDWFRMDRKIFEFQRGTNLFELYKNTYGKEPPPYRIPMKSTGSIGIRGILDENSLIEQRESFLSEIKTQDLKEVTIQDDNIKYDTVDYVYDDFQITGKEVKDLKKYDDFYNEKYIFRRYFTDEGKRLMDSFSDYAEMEDEDLEKWKILYSGDHHKTATDYFEIFLKKEYEKKYLNSESDTEVTGDNYDIDEKIEAKIEKMNLKMDQIDEIPKNVKEKEIFSEKIDINFYDKDYTLNEKWYNKMGLQKYEYSGFTAHIFIKEDGEDQPKLLLLFRGSDGGEEAFATNRDADWLYTNAKYGVSGYTEQFTCLRMFYEIAIEMYKRVIWENLYGGEYQLGGKDQIVSYSDKNIYLSGHSLGGGLSQYAALVSASVGYAQLKDGSRGVLDSDIYQSEEDLSLYKEDGCIKHYAASFNGPGMKLQARFSTSRLTNYGNLLAEPLYFLKEVTQEFPYIGNVLGSMFQGGGDLINVLTGIIGESPLRKIPPFDAAGKAGDLAGQSDLQMNAPLYFIMRMGIAGDRLNTFPKFINPADHGFKRKIKIEDVGDNEFFDFLISEGYIKRFKWSEDNILETAKKRRNYGYKISDKAYLQSRNGVNSLNFDSYKDETFTDMLMESPLGKGFSIFGGLELKGELDLDVYLAIIKRYGRHIRINAVGDNIRVQLKPMFYINAIKKLINDNFGLISYVAMESSERLRINVDKIGGKMDKHLSVKVLDWMRAANLLSVLSTAKFLWTGELIFELIHLEALRDVFNIKPIEISKMDPFAHFDIEGSWDSIFGNIINIDFKKIKKEKEKVVEYKREEFLMNYFIRCLNNTRIVQRAVIRSDSLKRRVDTGDYQTWWRNPRQMDGIPLSAYNISYEDNTGFDKVKAFLMRKDLTPNLIPSIGLKIEVDYGKYSEDDTSGSGNRAIVKGIKWALTMIPKVGLLTKTLIGEGTDLGQYHAIGNFLPFVKFDENDGLTGDDGDLEKGQFMHRKINMETLRSYIRTLIIITLDKKNFKKIKKYGKSFREGYKLHENLYNTKQWDRSITIPSFNTYNVLSKEGRKGAGEREKIYILQSQIARNISMHFQRKYGKEFFDKNDEEIIRDILKEVMKKTKFKKLGLHIVEEHIHKTLWNFTYKGGLGKKNVFLGEGTLGSNYDLKKLIEKRTYSYDGKEVKSIYIGHMNAKNEQIKVKSGNNYQKNWHSTFFDEWLDVEKVIWTIGASSFVLPGYIRIDSEILEEPDINGGGIVSKEPLGLQRPYVVDGAELSCEFLDGDLRLVTSVQSKEYIEGKILAVEDDINMLPAGKCKKGGICSCLCGLGKWDSVSRSHEVAGHKPILSDAKIKCSVHTDAVITVKNPGQSMKKEN